MEGQPEERPGGAPREESRRNRIQVSSTKKPIFFYVNLAKRLLQRYGEVELSALGMAISTVVTVTEILKSGKFVIPQRITTLAVDLTDEGRGRPVQKAKLEIVLRKSEQFDELMAAATEEAQPASAEE
eukprot:jgi/Mesen1/273/ME1151581C09487